MEDYQLLINLHKTATRQGPGSEMETENALRLVRLDSAAPLKVADIGCGTGASTLTLARLLKAHLTAVDFLPDFLETLEKNAQAAGLDDKISTLACSMDALPFAEAEYDLIWSEGAIYNIGFEKGIRDWKRYLKVGGVLAVSEITWITASRPAEVEAYWLAEYPEIDVASVKIGQLEQSGYSPVGYFFLPQSCWLENYYHPILARLDDFLRRNGNSPEAQEIAAIERREIELYEQYKDYYSYGFYIARKLG